MNRRPLVWFAVCWVCGSAAASGFEPAGIGFAAGAAALGAIAAVTGKLASMRLAAACLLAFGLAGGERLWFDARNMTALTDIEPAAEADPRAAYSVDALGTIVSAIEVDGDRAVFRMEATSLHAPAFGPPRKIRERLLVQLRLSAQPEQAAAAAWQRGDRVRVAGELTRPATATNRGGFDYRRYLRSQSIHWLLQAKGAAAVTPQAAAAPTFHAAALLGRVDAARASLGARLDELYPSSQSGYMKGLILGIREDLDPDQFGQFAELGLTHILAISGLHVAVFIYAAGGLLKLARMSRERMLTVLMIAVPFYVLLAGASPSVLRAGVMAVFGLLAARLGKLKDGLHLLAAAAVVLLAFNPYYLDDVSFQLSFVVTLGLIMGVPPVRGALPKWKRGGWLLDLAAVTIVAQLVSFPLTVYYFNQFHLLSLAANFVLVPFISFVVMPIGASALLLSVIWPEGARALVFVSSHTNEWTFGMTEWLATFDGLRTIWATPAVWWVLGWLLMLGYGFRLIKRRNGCVEEVYFTTQLRSGTDGEEAAAGAKLKSGQTSEPISKQKSNQTSLRPPPIGKLPVFLLAFSAGSLLLTAYWPDILDRKAVVSFLDVGQGDAALIRTPEGNHILIDGGGSLSFVKPGEEWRARRDPFEVGAKVVVPLLKKRGVKKLDLLIVSHLDSDHIKGLSAVLQHIPVKRIWWNGTVRESKDAKRFIEQALAAHIPLYAPKSGTSMKLGSETNVQVIWPHLVEGEGSALVPVVEEQNERSLIVLIDLYRYRFLFSGDISEGTEKAVIRHQNASPSVEQMSESKTHIMKVAHHGSRYSTSEEWLAYWQPLAAVISAGARNSYGHPHPDVLHKLDSAGISIWRTDKGGEASFRVSANGLEVWNR
ncbi:ComEC/Rec2 family competence protein [Paenibacillus sp. GCM10027627]|uniref:ComEC/Rec2 family competence protein n=1 Tax=unclassified Paenibacillus TaxID=185978 RepID=UPI00362A7337